MCGEVGWCTHCYNVRTYLLRNAAPGRLHRAEPPCRLRDLRVVAACRQPCLLADCTVLHWAFRHRGCARALLCEGLNLCRLLLSRPIILFSAMSHCHCLACRLSTRRLHAASHQVLPTVRPVYFWFRRPTNHAISPTVQSRPHTCIPNWASCAPLNSQRERREKEEREY